MAGEFYENGGTPVARSGGVFRRVLAFVAIVIIVLLALTVIWRVYLHHQSDEPRDEPTIVELAARFA